MTGCQHNCPACGHRIEDLPQEGWSRPDRIADGNFLITSSEICEGCGASLNIYMIVPPARCDIGVYEKMEVTRG